MKGREWKGRCCAGVGIPVVGLQQVGTPATASLACATTAIVVGKGVGIKDRVRLLPRSVVLLLLHTLLLIRMF
ncbi:hypothetical protein [Candidatus Ichthyocystis hellenicum]|uniref:hypothetical protein n=1 Tax=Candidatus Ichthyocystis hellenicum TaxID=1561003 RepID=UPI000B84BEB6|nr:hypothetical protein [Candidatus Ichthyocystis hellenicum]